MVMIVGIVVVVVVVVVATASAIDSCRMITIWRRAGKAGTMMARGCRRRQDVR